MIARQPVILPHRREPSSNRRRRDKSYPLASTGRGYTPKASKPMLDVALPQGRRRVARHIQVNEPNPAPMFATPSLMHFARRTTPFDGAAIAIATANSSAFGAPLRGSGT